MNAFRESLGWAEVPLTPGRKTAGGGLFRRVDYIDFTDGCGGRGAVRILASGNGATGLSQVLSTGHEIGLEEDRFTTLILPLAGKIFCAVGADDLAARAGDALILPPGRRRTLTRREGTADFHAIVLDLTDLPRQPDRARTVQMKALADLALAADMLRSICADPAPSSAGALASVRQLLRGALPVGAAESGGRTPHLRAVSPALARAETLLHDRFCEDLSINAVAEEVGISLRQLQDLFRRKHGLSPHGYLTRLRLEHAHLQLKGTIPAASVTDAALAAGFSHLGRFSGTYRGRFGSLPSTTRASPQ
jgi:AraC-like DNA-binding protein